ncbi:MAG: GNAT family N-acetyltransferase [Kaiparowitsia implicata GSE-PSE-MK54-09C]|jgi:GNAT superfamily N-acetyltransferase|nr:GNAT family N-acetyltransferase [Kaiparowitsia implicata GSE-PSE-MK54-09C]
MLIRPAKPEDVDTLFRIRMSVHENQASIERLAELGITPNSVEEIIKLPNAAWLASIDGKDVGFAIIDPRMGSLLGLFVHPGYEGRGAGKALLKTAEEALYARGFQQIWLDTSDDMSTRAHQFYRNQGWIPIGKVGSQLFRYENKV